MGCDLPFGEHPFRAEAWEYKQEDFKQTVDVLGPIVPRIRIMGGESTMLDVDKINESISYANSRVDIQTLSNGFNLLAVDYKKFDIVYLDDHVYNSEWVKEVYDTIKDEVETIILYRTTHNDLEWMIEYGPKTGETCNIYKKLPMIYKEVLFPCCSSLFYNMNLYGILDDAGWNIYNDNFLENINIIPEEFWEICREKCYANSIEAPYVELAGAVKGVIKK